MVDRAVDVTAGIVAITASTVAVGAAGTARVAAEVDLEDPVDGRSVKEQLWVRMFDSGWD